MRLHVLDERTVGAYRVQICVDPDPSHPDEGSVDLFLVAFHRHFHVEHGEFTAPCDFRQFVRPDFRADIDHEKWTDLSGTERTAPVRGDQRYQEAYAEASGNAIVELLVASGVTLLEFSDRVGRDAAEDDYYHRMDVWNTWNEYEEAHAKWACFGVSVRDYGGGCMGVGLIGLFTGEEQDEYGDPKFPDAWVLVRNDAGWHSPPEEVAEMLLTSWRKYLDGEIVGYRVVREDDEDDVLDSCWGYEDSDDAMEEGVALAEYYNKQDEVNKDGDRHSHVRGEAESGDLVPCEPAAPV